MSTFKFISGFRRNSKLLYVEDEKFLYVKKKSNKKNNKDLYICYQSIMIKNKNLSIVKCTAGVILVSTSKCKRNSVQHSHHENHEMLYLKFTTRKLMVDDCINLNTLGYGSNVSSRVIFTKAIAK